MKKKFDIKHLLLSSSINLTLSDRRLYNYLLLHAFSALPKKLNFSIPFKNLAGVYGTTLPTVERLQESLRRLIRTLIEFQTISGEWVITSLLNSAEIEVPAAIVHYSYPKLCQQLFADPLMLERCLIQAHFTQKYSNLLYEILLEETKGIQSEMTLEISDLRGRLQVEINKLTNFSDFNRFVLTPALNEINAYASFTVKWHTERKGMKVTHVIFNIAHKINFNNITSAKQIIPAKRPRLFIDNPELEKAYAYLLVTDTKDRRKYFNLAIKYAAKKKIKIDGSEFDRPDLWFCWVEQELLKNIK